MEYLIQGIILGLILSYLPGPIFWGLIQVGIERGFRAALTYASGIWVCDIFFVFATYFGVSYLVALTQIQGFNIYLAFIGGGILIASGLGTLIAKPPHLIENHQLSDRSVSWLGLFLRGFFFNLFNPGTIFFWLGISSQLSSHQPSGQDALLFFGGMWSGLISSDIIKSYLAKQIKTRMTPHVLWITKMIISAILVGTGAFLILRVLWKH
jgi:threonine/homoserine/homoserine lactone efflux protein